MKLFYLLLLLFFSLKLLATDLRTSDLFHEYEAFHKNSKRLSLSPGYVALTGGIAENFLEYQFQEGPILDFLSQVFHRVSIEEFGVTNIEAKPANYFHPKLLGEIAYRLWVWHFQSAEIKNSHKIRQKFITSILSLIKSNPQVKNKLKNTEAMYKNISSQLAQIEPHLAEQKKSLERNLIRFNLGKKQKSFNRALRKLITSTVQAASEDFKNQNIDFFKFFTSFVAARCENRNDVWSYLHGLAHAQRSFEPSKFGLSNKIITPLFHKPVLFLGTDQGHHWVNLPVPEPPKQHELKKLSYSQALHYMSSIVHAAKNKWITQYFMKWHTAYINRFNDKPIQSFSDCGSTALRKLFLMLLLQKDGTINLNLLKSLPKIHEKLLSYFQDFSTGKLLNSKDARDRWADVTSNLDDNLLIHENSFFKKPEKLDYVKTVGRDKFELEAGYYNFELFLRALTGVKNCENFLSKISQAGGPKTKLTKKLDSNSTKYGIFIFETSDRGKFILELSSIHFKFYPAAPENKTKQNWPELLDMPQPILDLYSWSPLGRPYQSNYKFKIIFNNKIEYKILLHKFADEDQQLNFLYKFKTLSSIPKISRAVFTRLRHPDALVRFMRILGFSNYGIIRPELAMLDRKNRCFLSNQIQAMLQFDPTSQWFALLALYQSKLFEGCEQEIRSHLDLNKQNSMGNLFHYIFLEKHNKYNNLEDKVFTSKIWEFLVNNYQEFLGSKNRSLKNPLESLKDCSTKRPEFILDSLLNQKILVQVGGLEPTIKYVFKHADIALLQRLTTVYKKETIEAINNMSLFHEAIAYVHSPDSWGSKTKKERNEIRQRYSLLSQEFLKLNIIVNKRGGLKLSGRQYLNPSTPFSLLISLGHKENMLLKELVAHKNFIYTDLEAELLAVLSSPYRSFVDDLIAKLPEEISEESLEKYFETSLLNKNVTAIKSLLERFPTKGVKAASKIGLLHATLLIAQNNFDHTWMNLARFLLKFDINITYSASMNLASHHKRDVMYNNPNPLATIVRFPERPLAKDIYLDIVTHKSFNPFSITTEAIEGATKYCNANLLEYLVSQLPPNFYIRFYLIQDIFDTYIIKDAYEKWLIFHKKWPGKIKYPN